MKREIEDFVQHLVDMGSYSPRTVQAYRYELMRFLQFCGGVAPERIRTSDLRLYEMKIARSNGVAGQRRAFAALGMLLKWLLRQGLIQTDPMQGLDRRGPAETARRELSHLTSAEMRKLARAVEDVAFPPRKTRDLAILDLMLQAGARLSEIAILSCGDVNLQEGVITLGLGKSQRQIPLNAQLRRTLLAHLPNVTTEDGAPLFTNNKGGRLTKDGVYYLVKRYLRAAEIVKKKGKASPHTLRHTFCAQLLLRGASVAVVQELAGLASIAPITLDISLADKEKAVELLKDPSI